MICPIIDNELKAGFYFTLWNIAVFEILNGFVEDCNKSSFFTAVFDDFLSSAVKFWLAKV